MGNNLYIPSIDAKDLYISNNYIKNSPCGYKLAHKDETKHLRKYISSFDYSLDLIELRKGASSIYGKKDSLSFIYKGKEYSSKIINVTFKYALKEFNQIKHNVYVRNGYNIEDYALAGGYASDFDNNGNEILAAIKVNEPFYNPVPSYLLPPYFSCEYNDENMVYIYTISKTIKTVKTSKELRKWCYNNGFICNSTNYCRFKRSSGSARVGKCLFIDERLYPYMHKSEQCGLDIKTGDSLDIAAFEAYISLSTSSITDTLDIKPENILVIDDWTSTFHEKAVCTDLGDNGWLDTKEKELEISNSIWDGQSLIDISLMDRYSTKGMLLLRNKFFKSCCFNTNIQKFFKDNNITAISQLNGITSATSIDDIKLITTPSSIKFYKFGDLKTWLENIYPFFGIVKYDKNTHYFDGRMVQAHYQLLNTLQLSQDEVWQLVQDGLEYVNLINTDADVMRYHLKINNSNETCTDNIMKNKNEIIYKLLNYDCRFEQTRIYYDFKKNLCRSYLKNMKKGHILLDGTYATLFGNPYEMLLQSIGKFNGITVLQPGTVHNTRYPYGTDILGSRSPHVTIGNILVSRNTECGIIDKYFNLTPNIICINSINENILERLSGADFDSDSMLITNNSMLINAAKKNYHIFKVPTRNTNPPKSKRYYTPDDLADLDDKTSNNKIGEIVNLSQELNSLLWDIVYKSGQSAEEQYGYIKEIYYDVCQLDVMSNIEIDKAKKEYPVDTTSELKKIREKYKAVLSAPYGRKKMPYFLGFIADTKNYKNDDKKDYQKYYTSMDYLHTCIGQKRSGKSKGNSFLPLSDIFKPDDYDKNRVNKKQVCKIIDMAEKTARYNRIVSGSQFLSIEEKYNYIQQSKENLLYGINKLKINSHTMYRLLWNLDNGKNPSIKNLLFYILFNYKNDLLTEILNHYDKIKNFLTEDEKGEICIYNCRFSKKSSPWQFPGS
ncbi:MAG: hypothetical protein HFH68_00285 [Lachnospiraceae bacterium]|nr:hypothetical protein [Lachnospiraceae bacterium]